MTWTTFRKVSGWFLITGGTMFLTLYFCGAFGVDVFTGSSISIFIGGLLYPEFLPDKSRQ